MKKRTTVKDPEAGNGEDVANPVTKKLAAQQRLTIGLDLGDRASRYCISE